MIENDQFRGKDGYNFELAEAIRDICDLKMTVIIRKKKAGGSHEAHRKRAQRKRNEDIN